MRHRAQLSIAAPLLAFVLLSVAVGCQGGEGGGEPSSDVGQIPQGNVPEEMRDLVVARVGDTPITMGDVQDKIAIQYGSLLELEGLDDVKQRDQILNLYIEELCWVELGKKLGYDKTPRFQKTVELARRFTLSDIVLKEFVGKRALPTEEAVRQFYEENAASFKIPKRAITRYLMTRTREEAEEARGKLLAGGAWDKVAGEYSIEKTTGTRGGFAGAVTVDNDILGLGKVPEFNATVMALAEGEYSEPFETSKGWIVAYVEEHRPEGMKPLEEIRPSIEKRLQREAAVEVRRAIYDSLKTALGVERYQDAMDTYMMEVLSTKDLLSQARRPDVEARKKIKFYEALLRRVPESPSCPEAQFMIGFLYAEELGDEEAARDALEKLLRDYPESDLVSAARRLLESLDGSDDAEGGSEDRPPGAPGAGD